MDIVDELRAFVATAQTLSFSAAADQLGVSNRLTSKYVAELEARLGVRLFQRTTRKVGLTPAGENLLARAPALLDDLDGLLSEVTDASRGLSGVVRISAPLTFGELYVAGMLARFAQNHPDLIVDLRLSDAYVDLATEGIDVAFRLGQSEMLSLKTRKLGTFGSVLVASPDYLANAGHPETPHDLEKHACIVDTNRRNPRRWQFSKDGKDVTAHVTGRFLVNSGRAAVDFACHARGITYVPRFAVNDAMASGELVRVLPDYAGETGPLSAVYLEGRKLPRKVRAIIDFAVDDIRSSSII